jgi:hypothetical protein
MLFKTGRDSLFLNFATCKFWLFFIPDRECSFPRSVLPNVFLSAAFVFALKDAPENLSKKLLIRSLLSSLFLFFSRSGGSREGFGCFHVF